jgi:acyl-CoA synthetase (AMP-forming)/AMP-acid ligase II
MITAFDCEFQQWYGQTELGGVTALHDSDHRSGDTQSLGSVGVPMMGYEVTIRDDSGLPVANGDVGEIACRGPGSMTKYWNRSMESTVKDGWLYTGDIGRFDDRGFLHLLDRRNNMIVTGGENVYPAEVESALADADGLDDVVVMGVPDATWGELVAAVFVGTASVVGLIAHLCDRLATYKVPRVWLPTDAIQRNAVGKPVRPAAFELMKAAMANGEAVLRGPQRQSGQ